MKICLRGKHRTRTPFAYEPLARHFRKGCELVDDPKHADFCVYGFGVDIKAEGTDLLRAMDANPRLRLAVVSEEPLWDTLWSNDCNGRIQKTQIQNVPVEYVALNHATTRIYDFDRIPYFITTSDDFFVRYAHLFRRNTQMTRKALRRLWSDAQIRAAFIAEKRTGEAYKSKSNPERLFGLSTYRTELAIACRGSRVLREGRGWKPSQTKRQALADWHLDKIAALDGNSFVISAIENTHHVTYVTEKLFDAFASRGVPLYVASPGHRVLDLVERGSFENLWHEPADDAACRLEHLLPTSAFVDAYMTTQVRLAELFADPGPMVDERRRVAIDTVAELEASRTA